MNINKYSQPLVQGIWSGIPMPWNDREELDAGVLRRNLKRCVETGSHGIYVCGTTGEFHAVSQKQFENIAEVFMDTMGNYPNIGVQVGCGGFSLRQVCERITVAISNGCGLIQLPLTGWQPLTDDEVLSFYRTVSDRFPDVGIFVYDNPQCGRTIGSHLWPDLLEMVPSIVGAKIVGITPELAHMIFGIREDFVILSGENNLVPLWKDGVRSLAAWISYAFPKIINDLWESLENGDAEGINDGIEKLMVITTIKDSIRQEGYRSGIMDRLMGLATGFLEPVYCRVLAPWRSVEPQHVEMIRMKIVDMLGSEYLYDRM